eukprot:COSAG05_NODE_16431_length_346_cov_0.838057_1_plen_22_part_10
MERDQKEQASQTHPGPLPVNQH